MSRVAIIRREDRWQEFREQAITRETAGRHGLSLPFMLAAGSMDGQIAIESDERAARAAAIRAELAAVVLAMQATADKGSAQYSRLVSSVAALQAQLDGLLGLDVAKKVGTASAIARGRHAIRRQQPAMTPAARALLHADRPGHAADQDPDVTTLLPG